MKPEDFDIVFFDASNTLIAPDPPVEDAIAQALNGTARIGVEEIRLKLGPYFERALARINAGLKYCVSDEADRMFWEEFYLGFFNELGLKSFPPDAPRRVYEHYQQKGFGLFSDALPALERLRALGTRMGMISNFSSHLRGHLRRLGLDEFFDPIVVSAEKNCMKPDAEIFRVALSEAGCSDPGRALLVGDNPVDDIEGAGRAGMAAVLIDRRGTSGKTGVGARVIRSLEELF